MQNLLFLNKALIFDSIKLLSLSIQHLASGWIIEWIAIKFDTNFDEYFGGHQQVINFKLNTSLTENYQVLKAATKCLVRLIFLFILLIFFGQIVPDSSKYLEYTPNLDYF